MPLAIIKSLAEITGDSAKCEMRRALITGITGQDGSYLAEMLLTKGYEVHGVVRRSSTFSTGRIEHLYERLHLHYGDVTDGSGLYQLLREVQPHEVYNLAAQSHVRVSFDQPGYTASATGLGTLALLEAVHDVAPDARVYQASSSEQFGNEPSPQSESTAFRPRSPYACAKVFAHHIAVNYRESYGLHVSCGILFNHESPRRGETFVTRKIAQAVARIAAGKQDKLTLGNINAQRDWGFAGDYVQAMWLMLQQERPDDYVIATGETHSVREFLDVACARVGLDPAAIVEHDARYDRPAEVDCLLGDASKARLALNWKPTVTFLALVHMMVDAEVKALR